MSKISIVLAVLCAIHCAATPILLSIAPVLLGEFAHNWWLEAMMLGGGLVLGGYALIKGLLNQHERWEPLLLFLLGFSIILLGQTLDFHVMEHILTATGASFWIVAQLYNVHLEHKTHQCENHA